MARGEPLIRQWNLLKALQANYFGLSAEELADRLDCSKRQIQRDVKVLQLVGFPAYYEDRDLGKRFWRMSPKILDQQGLLLSVIEMISLFVSRQLLSPLAGTQFGDGLASALDKIKAVLPGKALEHFQGLDETLLVKLGPRHDYSGQDKEIRILNQAIAERRVLAIRYHSASKGGEFDAEFYPYGLVFFGTSLYCIGHLAEYGEVRTLKVDRFRGVSLTGRTFQRPTDFSLKTYLDGGFGIFAPGQLQTIRARFTGWAATNVREQQWHPTQRIVKDGGEQLVAQFELSDTTEFKRWLLGYGPCAVVLKPKELAEAVKADLAAAMAGYGKPQ